MWRECLGEVQSPSRVTQSDRVNDMEHAKQQQMVNLDRGLFLVRYAAAEDEVQPPKVRISPDPPSNKDISFLLHPDHNEAVLWQPETCLVVRALAPGKLAVQVIPMQEGGSVAATVRIEALSQGMTAPAPAQTKAASSLPNDSGEFRILGHVTGIGDVVVDANEWLAGPSAPLRIEGISLEWPGKPADLEIRYAVKTAKPHPISGRAMGLGSFAGTRGKAMPIVGVMLQVAGNAAENFQFAVEAIFLGSPALRVIGRRVVASGPTGREPLVGLRLSLDSMRQVSLGSVRQAKRPQAKSSAGKPRRSAGNVRVFRSRSKSK
jgi:hypothetical protein